jgi:histidine decarboxylase
MQRTKQLISRIKDLSEYSLGYPMSKDINVEAVLPLLAYPLNNLGDPFIDGIYGLNTKLEEREVVRFMANMFRPGSENIWGYVTNSGSEGNLYGLYLAREKLENPVAYYSSEVHYSVPKACHLLGLTSEVFTASPKGKSDLDALQSALAKHPDRDAVVIATIGTTMTEAKDDVSIIRALVTDCGVNARIHVDAALAGTYVAFGEEKIGYGFTDGADSISVSGHKFIGSPIPCGVVLAKWDEVTNVGKSIQCIGSFDSTINGSRNGFAIALLWETLNRYGVDGLRTRYHKARNLSINLTKRLRSIGLDAWQNPDALTVVVPRLSDKLIKKWQLASDGKWSHIVVMPGVTDSMLERFVLDCLS